MSSTAVASIILGIVTVFLSVLLGKKSGQKDAISEQLEATQAQLNASKKETQLAKENATEAQEIASQAKSQLSKAKVIAQQTAVETSILDSVKSTIIDYLKGNKDDNEMAEIRNSIENANERNDMDKLMQLSDLLAQRAVEKGCSAFSASNDEKSKE